MGVRRLYESSDRNGWAAYLSVLQHASSYGSMSNIEVHGKSLPITCCSITHRKAILAFVLRGPGPPGVDLHVSCEVCV